MSEIAYAAMFSVMTLFVAWHLVEGLRSGVMKAVIWGRLQADRRHNIIAFASIALYNTLLLVAGLYLIATSV